jgi:hypothetical protein
LKLAANKNFWTVRFLEVDGNELIERSALVGGEINGVEKVCGWLSLDLS